MTKKKTEITARHDAIPQSKTREIIFYKTDDGNVKVEVLLHDENLWLTQAKIAELFDVERPAITKHLKIFFSDGELEENSVCSRMEHTAADGKNYKTAFYNLDAIIAVGYRVNSKHAHFIPHLELSENAVIKKYLITATCQLRQTYRRKRKDWGYMMTDYKLAALRSATRFILISLQEW